MPTTPNRGYPYPATTAPATVPADLEKALSQVDADVQSLVDNRVVAEGDLNRLEQAVAAIEDAQALTAEQLAGKVDDTDSRLTNARTPTAHRHALADVDGLTTALDGKVATTDSRLTDARTPTAHRHAVADIDGLADRLAALEQDTRARSLNDLITGRISGDVILQRVGKTVFLTINELMVTPNNGTATWSLGSLLPVGFRFFPPAYRYFSGFARTANHNRGEIRVNRYGGLDIYNVNGLATNVSASWPTADAFPTTLPGTPA